MFENFYRNKRVLIIGNTGFKGTWLSIWLLHLGAKVYGFSKNIPTKPSMYKSTSLDKKIKTYFSNINNLHSVIKIINKVKPNLIFHLAAQPLVLKSYKNPIETFQTNSLGFANILEALRVLNKPITTVMITSDKVYRNDERQKGYKEDDILHGIDPYSASKSCSEIIFSSYVNSYFKKKKTKIKIASGRAGNVIGGGDWADNRIVPDIVRSKILKKKLTLKNPKSTRPWQHVLEPLSGYLLLGKILNSKKRKIIDGDSFNFGPPFNQNKTVMELIKKYDDKLLVKKSKSKRKIYEAKLLSLNCQKAKKTLNWNPVLNFNQLVDFTSSWYKNYYNKTKSISSYKFSIDQINQYQMIAKKKKIQWAK
tara:strand:- start:3613 stop:4707 length:1095 start_codon:yes stop_codon:yes gene_type:complete